MLAASNDRAKLVSLRQPSFCPPLPHLSGTLRRRHSLTTQTHVLPTLSYYRGRRSKPILKGEGILRALRRRNYEGRRINDAWVKEHQLEASSYCISQEDLLSNDSAKVTLSSVQLQTLPTKSEFKNAKKIQKIEKGTPSLEQPHQSNKLCRYYRQNKPVFICGSNLDGGDADTYLHLTSAHWASCWCSAAWSSAAWWCVGNWMARPREFSAWCSIRVVSGSGSDNRIHCQRWVGWCYIEVGL